MSILILELVAYYLPEPLPSEQPVTNLHSDSALPAISAKVESTLAAVKPRSKKSAALCDTIECLKPLF